MPFTVLDDGVGRREENALVAVRPSNQVGRTAVVAVDLDDLAVTVFVPLMTALDRQLVSDRSFHGSPFMALLPLAGTYPVCPMASPPRSCWPWSPGRTRPKVRSARDN